MNKLLFKIIVTAGSVFIVVLIVYGFWHSEKRQAPQSKGVTRIEKERKAQPAVRGKALQPSTRLRGEFVEPKFSETAARKKLSPTVRALYEAGSSPSQIGGQPRSQYPTANEYAKRMRQHNSKRLRVIQAIGAVTTGTEQLSSQGYVAPIDSEISSFTSSPSSTAIESQPVLSPWLPKRNNIIAKETSLAHKSGTDAKKAVELMLEVSKRYRQGNSVAEKTTSSKADDAIAFLNRTPTQHRLQFNAQGKKRI